MSETFIWCFIFCVGFGTAEGRPPGNLPATVDTYCQTYQQVAKTKEEVAQIFKLPKELRTRVQANDLLYACVCRKLKDKVCE